MAARKHSSRRTSTGLLVAVATAATMGAVAAPTAALAEEATPDASSQAQASAQPTESQPATSQAQAVPTATTSGSATSTQSTTAAAATSTQPAAAATSTQPAATAATAATATAPEPAAEPTAAPASGTDGSYEENGIYRVTVRYVDSTGSQLAPSWQCELAEGESWSAESPSIEGYQLADPAQSTVAGTAAGDDHDPTYTVTYANVMATYQVVYELQVSGGYRVDRESEHAAPAGTVAVAEPADIDGYHCVTAEQDRSVTVTADGKARIVLRYDQDQLSYGVYYRTGGSYVAPSTGHVGDALVPPTAPTKPGYGFAGWDTDGDGVADALPERFPDHDVTATAVWVPGQAAYEVRYYGEKQGDAYGGAKRYQLLGSVRQEGQTGTTTSPARQLDTSESGRFPFYQYASETSATIAGDGSTIVSVYYDWKPVTVKYYVLPDNDNALRDAYVMATRTENFGEDLWMPSGDEALKVYKEQRKGSKAHFVAWVSNRSGYERNFNASVVSANDIYFMDGKLFVLLWATFSDEAFRHYFISADEGVEEGSYADDTAKLVSETERTSDSYDIISDNPSSPTYPYEWRVSTAAWDGRDRSGILWGEWHKFSDMTPTADGLYRIPGTTGEVDLTVQNVLEVRYARRSYTISCVVDGDEVASEQLRWGTKFQAGGIVDPARLVAPEGTVFAGWGTRPTSTRYLSGELEMPTSNVRLYAQWKHPGSVVSFDTHGGTPVDSQTVAHDAKVTRPQRPTREGYVFGGWYFYGDGSTTPARFSFDMPIDHDLVLHAAWKSDGVQTTYTVVHVTEDGTELARETDDGLVGETVTATPLAAGDPARAGWRYVSSTGSTINLSPDAARNVVTFVYAKDPSYSYVVRAVDAATGEDLAHWVCVRSGDVVVDVDAPQVNGWRVRGRGTGYVGADGTREVVFLYDRVPAGGDQGENDPGQDTSLGQRDGAPSPVRASLVDTASRKHGAAEKDLLPQTSDVSRGGVVAALASVGAALAAAGSRLRRRED